MPTCIAATCGSRPIAASAPATGAAVAVPGGRRTAAVHGRADRAFAGVAEELARQLKGAFGGGAVAVYHRGRPVVDVWGGVRSPARDPWQADTMAVSFSTTKGVTATLLHRQVDQGRLAYDQPVAELWPGFAAGGKERITVADVLCHRAGLHDVRRLVDDPLDMADWGRMTDRLAAAEPDFPPPRRSAYHALTFGWLAGELAARAAGRPFAELLASELAAPLGLDGCFIGAPEAALNRTAELMPRSRPTAGGDLTTSRSSRSRRRRRRQRRVVQALDRVGLIDIEAITGALMVRGLKHRRFNDPDLLTASIPAANGLFTARSLARMYAALAGGGELDGARILSPETIRLARQRQTRGRDRVIGFPMGWRLGYHRAFTRRGAIPGAFGHFGFGGSGAWASPRHDLAFAYTTNYGAGSPVGDLRIVRLGSAAVAAARQAG